MSWYNPYESESKFDRSRKLPVCTELVSHNAVKLKKEIFEWKII